MASPKDVALWILRQIEQHGYAYQQIIAPQISQQFGPEFVYKNKSLGLSLTPAVLRSFNTLTGDGVVWERSVKRWVARRSHHKPGRQQD